MHSEEGAQFRSRAFATTWRGTGPEGSLGHAASAAYSATIESLFVLLQKRVPDRQR